MFLRTVLKYYRVFNNITLLMYALSNFHFKNNKRALFKCRVILRLYVLLNFFLFQPPACRNAKFPHLRVKAILTAFLQVQ